MASETFVSAMMLITGVVAASILIVAVLPMIWGMVGTFSSASAATDRSMRTDFKIVTTYAKYTAVGLPPPQSGAAATVWMKNVGTSRIGYKEIDAADVYFGRSDNFGRGTLMSPNYSALDKSSTTAIRWNFFIRETTGVGTAGTWEPGETLEVNAFFPYSSSLIGQPMYFQLTLPSGVSRSSEFTSS